jgi:hypothetical protein
LTQQADEYVTMIQILEITICFISLGVITFEAFSIVIPAIHDYKKALDELSKVASEKRGQKEKQ